MSGVNKVILVGYLGKDPEVRHLENGAVVASFSLATTEMFTNKAGAKTEQTEWHNIVLWRGLAEVAEKYLKKGKQIYVEGKIKSSTYDDKEGIKRYKTEIVATSFTMLGKKDDGDSAYVAASNGASELTVSAVAEVGDESDSLPF